MKGMKIIECPDCGGEFKAATRGEILSILYDYYLLHHKEIITKANGEEKKAWMEDFERRWNAAEETAA